ncbi:MAG: ABC transporter permease subunit [Pseudomonadota bacterium]
MASRIGSFARTSSFFGFVFLYAPIVSLVVYSFNASELVTVWGGFSTRWYRELWTDEQILRAALISLQIAAISATFALFVGGLAALVLVRFGRFRFRQLLTGMITAPVVMPEVVTGLSLLLLFVSMEALLNWPAERGVLTVVIAHTTFASAFVAIVVQSRLSDMDPATEEAAGDLGARPLRVFFDITLPAIAPALIASWLLAFTLSLDDLVIASFVSGPGASTLPIVIFSKVRLGVSPDVNALATIMIAFVAVGVFLAAVFIKRNQSN